jgi:hypothetical protein
MGERNILEAIKKHADVRRLLVETESVPTIPRFLHRYRAVKDDFDSLRKILVENRWYFGSRVNFDDQEDCVVPGVTVDRSYLEKLARTHFGTLTPELRIQIEQLLADPQAEKRAKADLQGSIDNVGILCLSELDDDSELWRIYADNGRGVCLRLDMTKLINREPFLLRGPFEVTYRNGPKMIWDSQAGKDLQLAQTEDQLLRKGEQWAYQKEWRFFMHRGADRTVSEHPMPTDALSAVILGRALTESECREVSGWIRSGPWNPAPTLCCRGPEQSKYWL